MRQVVPGRFRQAVPLLALALLAAQGCSSSAKKKAPAPEVSKPVSSRSLRSEFRKASKLDEASKWGDALAGYEKFLSDAERFRKQEPTPAAPPVQNLGHGGALESSEVLEGENAITEEHEEIARERVGILRCIVARGGDYRFKSQEDLIARLTTALRKGDEKQLSQMASCDFVVGEPHSDDAERVSPEQVGAVLSLSKKAFQNPQSPRVEMFNILGFSTPEDTAQYGPTFEQEDHGWRWSGFVFNEWKQFQFVRTPRSARRKHQKH